jgi:hypothetical protein
MDSDVIFLSPESPLHSRKLKFLLQGCVWVKVARSKTQKSEVFLVWWQISETLFSENFQRIGNSERQISERVLRV